MNGSSYCLLRGKYSTLARETAGRKRTARPGAQTRDQARAAALAAQAELREVLLKCDAGTIDRATVLFAPNGARDGQRSIFRAILAEARTGLQPSNGITRINRAADALLTALREPSAGLKSPPLRFTLSPDEGAEFERLGCLISSGRIAAGVAALQQRAAWLADLARMRLGDNRKWPLKLTKEDGVWIAERAKG